jgi:hypothetical protein
MACPDLLVQRGQHAVRSEHEHPGLTTGEPVHAADRLDREPRDVRGSARWATERRLRWDFPVEEMTDLGEWPMPTMSWSVGNSQEGDWQLACVP